MRTLTLRSRQVSQPLNFPGTPTMVEATYVLNTQKIMVLSQHDRRYLFSILYEAVRLGGKSTSLSSRELEP